jgi:hypothetical protein
MIPRSAAFRSAVLLAAATPLTAQAATPIPADTPRFERHWPGTYDGPRRLELSASAGYALSSAWSDLVTMQVHDPHGAIHQQVLLRNVRVAPGASVGGAITYWRGRHGFRVHGGYMQSCLTTATRCSDADVAPPPPPNGAALAIAEVPMDVYRYGVEGLVGLRSWAESRFWRPYLVVGAGGVTFDPDAAALPFLPGTFETVVPPTATPGSIVVTDGTSTFLVAAGELGMEHVFGLTVGIGMDLRVPVDIGGVSLRVELVDQITSSPFSVEIARLEGGGRRHRGADVVAYRKGALHNVRLMVGVGLEVGLPGPRTEHDPWRQIRGR